MILTPYTDYFPKQLAFIMVMNSVLCEVQLKFLQNKIKIRENKNK